MENRIIELALETLAARRAAIENEIAELKSALEGRGAPEVVQAKRGRKSHSAAMKAYWARRKAAAAASPVPPKNQVSKRRPFSEAARKAVSKRMKAYWAKQRADKAKIAKKS